MKDSTMLSVYILGMLFLLVNWNKITISDSTLLHIFVFAFLTSSVGTAILFLLVNTIRYIKKKRNNNKLNNQEVKK